MDKTPRLTAIRSNFYKLKNTSFTTIVFRGATMTEVVIKAPKISPEEYEKYRGKNVAIYKNKIIAEGNNSNEALQKARQKHPKLKPEQIEIYYIQIADELIL
jgi:hypothetical protein